MRFDDLSRRELLRRSALAGGAVLAGPTLLAACGDDDDGGGSGTESAQTKKAGGVFRVGLGGGSTSDTIDAHKLLSGIDGARLANLYDKLFDYDNDFKVEAVLAESAEPNETADVWTVRIREGVEFHNGKTFTADDVIFSIQRMLDPDIASPAASRLPPMNPKTGMKKLDNRTVQFNLDSPFALFQEAFTEDMIMMVPEGYDPKKPVGTGAFTYQSFTPGRESTFIQNPNYWRDDGPYIDELQILDYGDDSARVNALLSGQLDAIGDVPYAQIKVLEGNDSVQMLNAESGFWRPITMRVDLPPFDDVRVRQALRLIADRPQIIEQALAGQGRLGNDVWGIDDACYSGNDLPQREQDVEEAKSLLRQAGQTNLSLELVTSNIRNGVVEMSEVYAEQARDAGINIKVNKVEPGVFFGDQYIKWPFAVDYWPPNGFFDQVRASSQPDSIWNETHFNDKEFNDLYQQAVAEVDEAKRCDIAHEMMKIQYDRGGYIIWGFGNIVDSYSTKFTGLEPSRASNLGSYAFRTVSLA